MRDSFIFNGKSSIEFDIWAFEKRQRGTPVRSTETITIPGMNGSLELDNGRYENVPVKYGCILIDDGKRRIDAFIDYMVRQKGYQRLEDTFSPDEFRLGRYIGGTDKTYVGEKGKFEISFDCKPQRFLKIGENEIDSTSEVVLLNPTNQVSLPIIRIYGTGEVMVTSEKLFTLTINENPGYIDFDSEIKDAHYGAVNCNGKFSGEFPEFGAGSTTITPGAGITRMVITPRWFAI